MRETTPSVIAADRIADDRDLVAKARHVPDLGRLDIVKKISRFDNFEEREVRIVADRLHPRDGLVGGGHLLDLHERRVGHDVRAREQQTGADHDGRTSAIRGSPRLPWSVEVRVLTRSEDADNLRVRRHDLRVPCTHGHSKV
jgi:hypothetical protein